LKRVSISKNKSLEGKKEKEKTNNFAYFLIYINLFIRLSSLIPNPKSRTWAETCSGALTYIKYKFKT